MRRIEVNAEAGTAVIFRKDGIRATVGISNYKAAAPDEGKPTEMGAEKNPQVLTPNYAPWGANNLFPQETSDLISGNTVLGRAMEDRAAIHMGQGIYAYREKIENGKSHTELIDLEKEYPEVSDWMEMNELNLRYFPGTTKDYEAYGINFPEVICRRDKSKINRLIYHQTCSGRWEKQDIKTKKIQNAFLCNFWDQSPAVEDIATLPVIDPHYAIESILGKPGTNFIFPSSLPDRKNYYYPQKSWYSIVTSKWLQISNKVPLLIDSLYERQNFWQYHVQIPYSFWPKTYPEWEKWSLKKRGEAMDEYLTVLDEFMSGAENAGKAFISGFGVDPVSGKEIPGFKIDPLDNKLKEGAFIPTSQEAAGHVLYACGLDSSIVGVAMPGSTLNSGSGSDKREAFLIHQAKIFIDRAITTAPLYFIKHYNKWAREIKFGFKDMDTSQVLSQNPSGSQGKVAGGGTDKNPTSNN